VATLLIGLISATALWSGVQALNQQARTSYDRAAATFGGARTAMLVGRTGLTFPQQLYVDLRRAGWPCLRFSKAAFRSAAASFRLLGIEPITIPVEVGNAPAIGRAGLQSFLTPPGEMLVAHEMLADLNLADGARPPASDGTPLPPLRAPSPTGAGCRGGRYRHRAAAVENAGPGFVAPDGKAKASRAPLESIAGDRLRLVEPDAESDTRTPHRQFSSQPRRLRPIVLRGRAVHRQFGDRAGVRAAGCRCCALCGPAACRREC